MNTPHASHDVEPLGIDLSAERTALTAYALPPLQRRVRDAVERAGFRRGVVVGAAAVLVLMSASASAAYATFLAATAPSRSPPTTSFAVAEPPVTITVTISTLARSSCPADGSPTSSSSSSSSSSSAAAAASSTTTTPSTDQDGDPAAADRDAGPSHERSDRASRLKVWLDAYGAIEAALAAGDDEHAIMQARSLRLRYPEGALAKEAAALEIKALRHARRGAEADALENELLMITPLTTTPATTTPIAPSTSEAGDGDGEVDDDDSDDVDAMQPVRLPPPRFGRIPDDDINDDDDDDDDDDDSNKGATP